MDFKSFCKLFMKRHHILSKLAWKLLLIKFHLQRRKKMLGLQKFAHLLPQLAIW